MNGLIVFIALVFLVAGAAYGIGAGTMKSSVDVIKAMEKAVAGLGGLIFLLFVISQFNAFFTYTNMATLAAVKMGDTLEAAGLGALPLLIGFVFVVGVLDLIMTGAIPKWAIFAPIFVPLLMRLGVEPEAVLAAYRVGDSPINAVSPLNAYFALIVAFAHEVPEGRRRRHGHRADAAVRRRALRGVAAAPGRCGTSSGFRGGSDAADLSKQPDARPALETLRSRKALTWLPTSRDVERGVDRRARASHGTSRRAEPVRFTVESSDSASDQAGRARRRRLRRRDAPTGGPKHRRGVEGKALGGHQRWATSTRGQVRRCRSTIVPGVAAERVLLVSLGRRDRVRRPGVPGCAQPAPRELWRRRRAGTRL